MVSLGIIGAGAWGKNHIRLAIELRDEGVVDRVLVCDTDRARLAPWEAKAETTLDVREARGANLDAVIVATPAPTHFPIAREFLSGGVHAFVEKPMTVRASEARALVDLSEREGLVLMPGHLFRYHPGVQELLASIRRGVLGEVRYLSTVRTAFATPRPDAGVLHSLGIHEVDMYSYLLAEDYPEEAYAHCAAFANPEVDEIASMSFRYATGTVGFAFESWITPGAVRRRLLTVVGTRRSAEVDYLRSDGITIFDTSMTKGPDGWTYDEGSPHTLAVEDREPLREEVTDFLRAVREGGRIRPRADAACGLRAVEVIDALRTKGSFIPAHRP